MKLTYCSLSLSMFTWIAGILTAFADDALRWAPNNHITDFKENANLLEGAVCGIDPFLVTKNLNAFPASEKNLIRFKLKVDSQEATIGELYWMRKGETNFSSMQRIAFPVKPERQWQTFEFEMSGYPRWQDKITVLRLDPVSGGKIPIHFSVCDFEILSQNIRLLPVDTWTIRSHLKNPKESSGTLTLEFAGNDPYIANLSVKFGADRFQILKFEMCLSPEAAPEAQIFWRIQDNANFSIANSFYLKTSNDGKWHEYTVNFSENPRWRGVITGLRIDPSNNPGRCPTVQFRNIRLESVSRK